MLKYLEKIFGSKKVKDIEDLLPIVDQINEIYEGFSSLTDEELRGKTAEFRARIRETTGELEDEAAELRERLKEDVPHEERVEIIDRIGEIGQQLEVLIKAALDELLPEAFAVVKEACRRLVGSKFVVAGQEIKWDM